MGVPQGEHGEPLHRHGFLEGAVWFARSRDASQRRLGGHDLVCMQHRVSPQVGLMPNNHGAETRSST